MIQVIVYLDQIAQVSGSQVSGHLPANFSGTSSGVSSLGPARTGTPDPNVCWVNAFSADLLQVLSYGMWRCRLVCQCPGQVTVSPWRFTGEYASQWAGQRDAAGLPPASWWHLESGPAAQGLSRSWVCPRSSSLKLLSSSRTPAPGRRRRPGRLSRCALPSVQFSSSSAVAGVSGSCNSDRQCGRSVRGNKVEQLSPSPCLLIPVPPRLGAAIWPVAC